MRAESAKARQLTVGLFGAVFASLFMLALASGCLCLLLCLSVVPPTPASLTPISRPSALLSVSPCIPTHIHPVMASRSSGTSVCAAAAFRLTMSLCSAHCTAAMSAHVGHGENRPCLVRAQAPGERAGGNKAHNQESADVDTERQLPHVIGPTKLAPKLIPEPARRCRPRGRSDIGGQARQLGSKSVPRC